MNIIYGIIVVLVLVGVILTVLVYIGLKVKKQEQDLLNDYNKEALAKFNRAKANNKYKRQSTPKVPTIKK